MQKILTTMIHFDYDRSVIGRGTRRCST